MAVDVDGDVGFSFTSHGDSDVFYPNQHNLNYIHTHRAWLFST